MEFGAFCKQNSLFIDNLTQKVESAFLKTLSDPVSQLKILILLSNVSTNILPTFFKLLYESAGNQGQERK